MPTHSNEHISVNKLDFVAQKKSHSYLSISFFISLIRLKFN